MFGSELLVAPIFNDLYAGLLQEQHIQPLLISPEGVEATCRQTAQGPLLFILNHQPTPASVTLPENTHYHNLLSEQEVVSVVEIEGYGVLILAER